MRRHAGQASHMRKWQSGASVRTAAGHLDGARIFNAALGARNQRERNCEQRGHGFILPVEGTRCPIGSLLCGSEDYIARAHVVRPRCSAAECARLVSSGSRNRALDTMIDRLAEVSECARAAQGLALVADSTCERSPIAPTWWSSTSMEMQKLQAVCRLDERTGAC